MSSSSSSHSIPSSILIIGSGVFGLSTAHALINHPEFQSTKITILERGDNAFAAPDAASIENSRIVRADYTSRPYAVLAALAQEGWRGDWGAEGRYVEDGLLLVEDGDPSEEQEGEESGWQAVKGFKDKWRFDGTGIDHWRARSESSPDQNAGEKKAYVKHSLENVLALSKEGLLPSSSTSRTITSLPTASAINKAFNTGGHTGTRGYLNPHSGWANAETSLRYLHSLVISSSHVTTIQGTVTHLLTSPSNPTQIIGAAYTTPSGTSTHKTADLVLLSSGSWTPSLLDLRGIASCTSQSLAYITVTPQEEAKYKDRPVILNMSTGLFVFPPREGVMKVARHAYGYANPTRIRLPRPSPPLEEKLPSMAEKPASVLSPGTRPSSTSTSALPSTSSTSPSRSQKRDEYVTISLPPKPPTPDLNHHPIPPRDHTLLQSFLRQTYPSLPPRPFSYTRLCNYLDTSSGDFIVTYHPSYTGLFVATGGSGHAFKFLPVLGRAVVQRILGRDVSGGFGVGEKGRGELDKLGDMWKWPERKGSQREEKEIGDGDGGEDWTRWMVWTEDGSRGGERGLVLRDVMQEGQQLRGKL